MYTLTPEVVVRGLRRKLEDSKRRNTVRNYYKLSTNYHLETNNNDIPCKYTYRLVPYLSHGLYMGFQPKKMLRRIGSRIMDLTQGYIIKLLLVTLQKHTQHLLPSLGYIGSRYSPLGQNVHHLTFKKSWPL